MYECSDFPVFLPILVTFYFKKVIAILVGVKWDIVVLICVSLVTNDIEHFFYILISH